MKTLLCPARTSIFFVLLGVPAGAALVAQAPVAEGPVAYTWADTRMVGGGFVTGIVFHPGEPGLAYCRTDIGGAYRWNSARQQWTPLQDWVSAADSNLMGIEAIGLDPTDPKRLYLAAGTYIGAGAREGALLRSVDQGRSFEVLPLPFKLGGNEDGRFSGERLVIDPNLPSRLYLGSRLNGLWKSDDRGGTWTKLPGLPVGPESRIGVVSIAVEVNSGRAGQPTPLLFAAVSGLTGGVYRSADAGATWSLLPGQPKGMLTTTARLSADGYLYVTYANAPGPNGMTDGAVWRYAVEHRQWKQITPETPGRGVDVPFGYSTLALDPAHPAVVYTATMDRWKGSDKIFRSADHGRRWREIANGQPHDAALSPWLKSPDGKQPGVGHWIGALAVDPFAPGHVLYGTGETVWATAEADAPQHAAVHWTVGALGIEETAVLALLSPREGVPLLSGLGDISGFRHDTLEQSPAAGNLRHPEFSNTPSLVEAALAPEVLARVGLTWHGEQYGAVSRDGGVTWQPFRAAPSGSRGGSVAVLADGATLVWSPRGMPAFVSRDDGASWTASAGVSAHVTLLADRRDPHRVFAWDAEGGTLYQSSDAGAHFTLAQTALPPGNTARVQLAPDNEFWLSSQDGLRRAATPYDSFVALPQVEQASAVGWGRGEHDDNPPAMYLAGRVAGRGGIFRSLDRGQSWTQISDAAHQFGYVSVITGDPKLFGRVYLGTNGRGIPYGDPLPQPQR